MKESNSDIQKPQRDLRDRVGDFLECIDLIDVRHAVINSSLPHMQPLVWTKARVSSTQQTYSLEDDFFDCVLGYRIELIDPDGDVVARIENIVVVNYAYNGKFDENDDEAITTFASQNSVFTAWPYVREAVQSATLRLGLDPLTLGMWHRGENTPRLISEAKAHVMNRDSSL